MIAALRADSLPPVPAPPPVYIYCNGVYLSNRADYPAHTARGEVCEVRNDPPVQTMSTTATPIASLFPVVNFFDASGPDTSAKAMLIAGGIVAALLLLR